VRDGIILRHKGNYTHHHTIRLWALAALTAGMCSTGQQYHPYVAINPQPSVAHVPNRKRVEYSAEYPSISSR
jgi:hypothetical protein